METNLLTPYTKGNTLDYQIQDLFNSLSPFPHGTLHYTSVRDRLQK